MTASRGNWLPAKHLTLLSNKLVQVATGDIKRLMIFMPPRSGKSQLTSQYFPSFFLGHHPDKRIILTSYEADFAASWGWKARNVFEEYCGDIFGLSVRGDSSARNRWDIEDHVGGMNTAGVGGAITGKGADLLIIDDPVKNAEEANSELKRDKAWEWYQSTAYTRLEPNAAIILIMTRWHPQDLGGLLLKDMDAGGEQWDIVKFPAIAEDGDLLGRTVGDPLWPERYPIKALENIRDTVGAYWWAAMYQQTPYSKTGGMFKRSEFNIVNSRGGQKQIRYWDLAASVKEGKKDPDWTVGCLMSESNGQYWIQDIVRVRESPGEVEKIIRQTANIDSINTKIYMEQEGGASGKSLISYYARVVLQGFSFKGLPSTGAKDVRAQPLASAISNGNVFLVSADWNTTLLDEFEQFPLGAHDDIVDSCSGAFNLLSENPSSNYSGFTIPESNRSNMPGFGSSGGIPGF